MKVIAWFVLGLFLSSCGNDETVTPPEPCLVDQASLTGAYVLQTDEVSGDCGRVGELEVELIDGVVVPNESVGCSLTDSQWDQATCTNDALHDCDDGDWVMRFDWVVSADLDDSDSISGTLSMEMSRWGGIYTCESEYSFIGTKK